MLTWPGPSARSFFRDPVAFVRANGGDRSVIRIGAGRNRFVLLRDPQDIWRVLVADRGSFQPGKWKRKSRRFVGEALIGLDGTEHRRRRQLLQPALDRRRIEACAPEMVSRVDAAQSGWEDGARIHAYREMARLSLLVAGDVLLSADFERDASELADALTAVMAAVPRPMPPLPGTRQARALTTVDRAISGLVAERRRSTRKEEGDLLGALVRSDLSQETVRGELLAFLLAATDEPPSGLEAAWYLLARSPRAEERLLAELDAELGGRVPTLADRTRLPYLDAVIRETLRLFPPVRLIDRCPVSDTRIGRARVRAGSNLIVSPLVTHREASLYEGPSHFLPERWLSTPREPPKGAYLPFGAGAHVCIGQPLALAIIWLTLATIGRRWRLRADRSASALAPRAPELRFTLERR